MDNMYEEHIILMYYILLFGAHTIDIHLINY